MDKCVDLSIVVIIYNRAEYIRECLDSALSQGCSKEIICVDDGSTDGTADILREYAARHEEIRLVCHESNEGTNITRYDGLSLCTGRYMTYLDGDDALIPHAMDGLVARAADEDIDVLEFWTEVIPCGECTPKHAADNQREFCPQERLIAGEDFCRLCFLEEKINTAQCGKLYARRVYREALAGMERIRMGNLYPQAWYLSWNMYLPVRTWRTVAQTGFRYYAGRGQTHRRHETLGHVRGNCDVQPALKSMKRTAQACGRLKEQLEIIGHVADMCRLQSVRSWAQRLPKENLTEGWRMLEAAWGVSGVVHVLTVLYARRAELAQESLAAIPWERNGLPGAACIVHAELTEAQKLHIWQRACAQDDAPLLLADESADVHCLTALGAPEPQRLPEGEERLLARGWMLRLCLSSASVGSVALAQTPAGFGDGLIAQELGCVVV